MTDLSQSAPTLAPTPTLAERNADIAAFILRVSTGAWFLVHGLIKLVVFTPADRKSVV